MHPEGMRQQLALEPRLVAQHRGEGIVSCGWLHPEHSRGRGKGDEVGGLGIVGEDDVVLTFQARGDGLKFLYGEVRSRRTAQAEHPVRLGAANYLL